MKKEQQKKTLNKLNSSFFISCPVCHKQGFSIIQQTDEIPYFGEVLETFGSCNECKYKTSDILPFEEKKAPTKQSFKVDSEDDLKTRVIKSKSCFIEIPEIDLTVEPGSSSEAYVTNVEGLLQRIEEKVSAMKVIHPEKSKEIDETVKKLKQMENGKLKFTIKFNDKTGFSMIFKET